MVRTAGAILALALAATAFGDDKIGNAKAPEILKKVHAELAKKKGWHVTEKIVLPQMPGGGGGGMPGDQSFDGVVKKDFAALKGPVEAFCKGPITLVKNAQGKFVEPKDLDGQTGAIAAAVRNPVVIVTDVIRFAGPSTFTSEEKVDEFDCKVAETWADSKSTEEQLKGIVANIKLPAQAGNIDIMQFVDKKKSSSAYKAWIGKETLLFHKVEWTVTVVIDKGKIPGGFGDQLPDKVEAKYELAIKDYDKDLDVEVPKEIKARFGLKDEPKKEEPKKDDKK